ncbi:MAG: hypothetical protein RL090_1326 [Bacteroidota bacterium]
MKFHLSIWLLALPFLVSCEKEELPYVLPTAGEIDTLTANMGVNYDNQVYVDFKTGSQKSVPYRSYDLSFETDANGFRIYLNTGKFMFVANSGDTSMTSADSTGKTWKTETEHLYDDSTAFGDYRDALGVSKGETYIIDRGRAEHFGSARWRKMKILEVTATNYRIRFSNYNNTGVTDFVIPKNTEYSLMYFSFENGGGLVDVAPKKNEWDVVFTKYTYTYYSEPVTSPYRHYLVTGALLNKWSGCVNEQYRKDSTVNYVPFDSFDATHLPDVSFNSLAGKIGFSWKDYDFSLGFIIIPNRFYLVRDTEGFVYKIRFYDFYDSQGNKGAAKFEYKRI